MTLDGRTCPCCAAPKPAPPGKRFNAQAFGVTVRRFRRHRKLDDVATETGVSASTISRIERGWSPSVEVYLRLLDWMMQAKGRAEMRA